MALRAYVGRTGDPADGRWAAHTEDDTLTGPPLVERTEWGTAGEAVGWAREQTGWVLVVDGPLRWAGTDPKPDDVPETWEEGENPPIKDT